MNKETNMTKFDKSKFSYHGGYLMYDVGNGDKHRWSPDQKFIARFKHRGPVTKGIFLKQLIKNHTVEEYLQKNANGMGIAPLTILKDADPKWYNAVLEAYQAKIQAKYGIRPIKFL
jgi:hypothetical protein